MENKNISVDIGMKSRSSSSQVKNSEKTLLQLFESVKTQIDYGHFDLTLRDQVRDIAMIIAEVYRLPASAAVRIDGNDLPAEMVAEVFGMITDEHVDYVLENIKTIRYQITHMKTYLRTALYNSVFEMEARTENEVRTDFGKL